MRVKPTVVFGRKCALNSPEPSSFCLFHHRDRVQDLCRCTAVVSRWGSAWMQPSTPRGIHASQDQPSCRFYTLLCESRRKANWGNFSIRKHSPTHSKVEWLSLESFSTNKFLIRFTSSGACLFFQFLNTASIRSEGNARREDKAEIADVAHWNFISTPAKNNYHMQR